MLLMTRVGGSRARRAVAGQEEGWTGACKRGCDRDERLKTTREDGQRKDKETRIEVTETQKLGRGGERDCSRSRTRGGWDKKKIGKVAASLSQSEVALLFTPCLNGRALSPQKRVSDSGDARQVARIARVRVHPRLGTDAASVPTFFKTTPMIHDGHASLNNLAPTCPSSAKWRVGHISLPLLVLFPICQHGLLSRPWPDDVTE